MISKAHFFLLVVLLLIPTRINAQDVVNRQNGIRCGYHFQKKYTPEGSYTKYLNMRLDYYDGESVFYDDFTYERDSLKLLAFDENGKIKNQEEYNKMRSLPRPRLDDMTIMDYKKGIAAQIYRQATITIRGDEQMLEPPSWELTEEVSTVGSYSCKKATAHYLGRTWTVWYTEKVPLPIGPWMLWGTPGLIVLAEDSEQLFRFQLEWTDELDNNNRLSFIDTCYPKSSFQKRGATKHFALSMKDAEQMNNRIKTDAAYMSELIGGRPRDMEGLQSRMKYIPLIPDAYWKGK